MTKPANGTRRATALHEAGHAVLARLMGCKITYVTIEPGADILGHVRFRKSRRRSETELAWERMIVALAGYTSERKGRFRPARHSVEPDRISAFNYATHFVGEDEIAGNQILRAARRRTKVLVDLHWPMIEAVSQSLLLQTRLSETELDSILGFGPTPEIA